MKSNSFSFFGLIGALLIAAMMGYGIYTALTNKGNKEKPIPVESEHPSITSLEEESVIKEESSTSSTIESIEPIKPIESASIIRGELNAKQLEILTSFDGEQFFAQKQDSNLTLTEEHTLAVTADERFKLNISAADVKFVFTKKVERDVIVHLRFYRKAEKQEPTLKLTLTESELEMGITMKSWSIPDNFEINALVYLPTNFAGLTINSSASAYLLEGETDVKVGELNIDTNASEGQIKLTRLELDELKLKVNAASTTVELDELIYNKRLYISNNAAGLKFKTAKMSGKGKNIEIDQNASGSDLEFRGLENLFINGDINLGSVSISKDGVREVYKKSFNYTIGEQERVMIINTNLGAVNLEF